jgi:hypothetical protein
MRQIELAPGRIVEIGLRRAGVVTDLELPIFVEQLRLATSSQHRTRGKREKADHGDHSSVHSNLRSMNVEIDRKRAARAARPPASLDPPEILA